METSSYNDFRNCEIWSYYESLKAIKSNCNSLKLGEALGIEQYLFLVESIADSFKGNLSRFSIYTNASMNENVIKYFSINSKTQKKMIVLSNDFGSALDQVDKAGMNLCQNYNTETLDNYKEKVKILKNRTEELTDFIVKAMVAGNINNCMLPKKSGVGKDERPDHGSFLAIKPFNNEKIKLNSNGILDVARNIAFFNNAFEDAENCDPSYIKFFFYDTLFSSDLRHYERAFKTAIEIMSKVTYNFVTSLNSHSDDWNPDFDSKSHQFQKLIVVLYSCKCKEFVEMNLESCGIIESAFTNKIFQHDNTIFVIGDDLFNLLGDDWKTYRAKFSKKTEKFGDHSYPVYWSEPIGWDSLRLFLSGSLFSTDIGYKQRKTRYNVPGEISVSISVENPETPHTFSGMLFDISRTGIRLLCDSDALIGSIKKESVIKIKSVSFGSEILEDKKGTLIYSYRTIDKKFTFLGLNFDQQIEKDTLLFFLTNCNLKCLSTEERI